MSVIQSETVTLQIHAMANTYDKTGKFLLNYSINLLWSKEPQLATSSEIKLTPSMPLCEVIEITWISPILCAPLCVFLIFYYFLGKIFLYTGLYLVTLLTLL